MTVQCLRGESPAEFALRAKIGGYPVVGEGRGGVVRCCRAPAGAGLHPIDSFRALRLGVSDVTSVNVAVICVIMPFLALHAAHCE